MRLSLVLFLAASLASTSASLIQRANPPPVPASQFKKFPTISQQDAEAGKDLPNGFTNSSTEQMNTFSIAATAQTAASAACSASPNVRFEWRQYSTSDRLAFVAAIRCLMNKPPSGNFPPATNRYEDFVRLHQMDMPNVHSNPKFLIWHRYYLWTFEQVLRTECGFDRAMPWWDETLDAGKFAQSDMFTNNAYFGHLLPPDSNGNGWCINSGAFGGITLHIGPGDGESAHCMSRSVDESLTAQCNQGFVNTCNSRTSYSDMESCMEYGPHAYGHNGIGAVMSDVSASPSDPIFWMHHSFVDHSFRIWQKGDEGVRTTSINGNDHSGTPLSMNTMVSVGGIRPDVRIGDIMNTLSGTVIGGVPFCYRYTY